MASRAFLPLFLDFNETTQELSDEECGRVVRALIQYANGEDYEDYLTTGYETMAFRFLKGSIDRNSKLSTSRAEAGAKGGKQRQQNRKQNEAKENLLEASSSKSKQNDINNDNDINNKSNNDNDNNCLLDADAIKIQQEQDLVLDSAENAGFKMSNDVRNILIALYADNGLDKMLAGFKSCVEHGAPTIAYLKACLKGEPRKDKKPSKTVAAQEYTQREYGDEDNAAMARMIQLVRDGT